MEYPWNRWSVSIHSTMDKFYRRHLPHYHPQWATFFITFRLVHSLSPGLVEHLHSAFANDIERVKSQRCFSVTEGKKAIAALHAQHFYVLDEVLDAQCEGNRWLLREDVARFVHEAILFRDDKEYELICSTVMPNHVHMICTVNGEAGEGYPIEHHSRKTAVTRILHSLKRYTARECNKQLGRTGPFWHNESYDRVVRDEGEMDRTIRYVLNNPVKAGLVTDPLQWKSSYCKYPLAGS